jgi:hydrogenase/urease accessory protein HupE
MRFILHILAALLPLCIAAPVSAHPVPVSFADLTIHDDRIEGSVTVHLTDLSRELGIDDPHMLFDKGVLDVQHTRINDILQRVRLSAEGGAALPLIMGKISPATGDDALKLAFTASGPPPAALAVQANLFPDDPLHRTFVNIYEDGDLKQQFLFAGDSAPKVHFAGTAAGVWAVLGTFVPSGIEHVLLGPDHVLFIVGLILLGGTIRRLAVIVTAFTIGHSVTLALAALSIVTPPAWLIEPAIALSIVVVGADNLMKGKGRDLRAVYAALFGLIHGFGFAFVLREFGLPQASLAWSLLGFNLGVELGQLAIVIPLALVLAAVRKRAPVVANRIVIGGSLAVIAAGVYWFVDRVQMLGSGV